MTGRSIPDLDGDAGTQFHETGYRQFITDFLRRQTHPLNGRKAQYAVLGLMDIRQLQTGSHHLFHGIEMDIIAIDRYRIRGYAERAALHVLGTEQQVFVHFHRHFFVVLGREDKFKRIRDYRLHLRSFPEELVHVGVDGTAYDAIGMRSRIAKVGPVKRDQHHVAFPAAAFPKKAESVGPATCAHHDRIYGLQTVSFDIALGHDRHADGPGIIL